MNKTFIEKIIMIVCQHCKTKLNQDEGVDFIVKCKNCSWFNRFRNEILEEEKIIKDPLGNIKIYKKRFGNGVLYTYPFDLRHIFFLKRTSQKSGEALEKFILYGKEKLSNLEKNILYKFKVQSIPKIQKKIDYLEAKKECIEILRLLKF